MIKLINKLLENKLIKYLLFILFILCCFNILFGAKINVYAYDLQTDSWSFDEINSADIYTDNCNLNGTDMSNKFCVYQNSTSSYVVAEKDDANIISAIYELQNQNPGYSYYFAIRGNMQERAYEIYLFQNENDLILMQTDQYALSIGTTYQNSTTLKFQMYVYDDNGNYNWAYSPLGIGNQDYEKIKNTSSYYRFGWDYLDNNIKIFTNLETITYKYNGYYNYTQTTPLYINGVEIADNTSLYIDVNTFSTTPIGVVDTSINWVFGGYNPTYLTVGDTYTDMGGVAYNNSGQSLDWELTGYDVDTSKVGTYTVNYSVWNIDHSLGTNYVRYVYVEDIAPNFIEIDLTNKYGLTLIPKMDEFPDSINTKVYYKGDLVTYLSFNNGSADITDEFGYLFWNWDADSSYIEKSLGMSNVYYENNPVWHIMKQKRDNSYAMFKFDTNKYDYVVWDNTTLSQDINGVTVILPPQPPTSSDYLDGIIDNGDVLDGSNTLSQLLTGFRDVIVGIVPFMIGIASLFGVFLNALPPQVSGILYAGLILGTIIALWKLIRGS